MMSKNDSQSNERGLRLHVAVQELYAAIQQTKRMVGERNSRPKAILSQLEDMGARLDAIYIETSLQQTALYDMTAIAQALRQAYDELVNDAETAYQTGWQDALKQGVGERTGGQRDGGQLADQDVGVRFSVACAGMGRGNRVDPGSAAIFGSE